MTNQRIQIESAVGALFVVISAVLLLWLGFQEQDNLGYTETQQLAESVETGAKLYEDNCSRCHGQNGEGQIGPPFNDAHFFDKSENGRMAEVGWLGTIEDYVIAIASSGRQISSRPDQWPGEGLPAMPTWSERYGGPLRDDQIRDIARFIVNWQPVAAGEAAVEILSVPAPLSADPAARGKAVFVQAGCAACHTVNNVSTGTVGPVLDGVAARAETRVAGLSAEAYLQESILDPNAYIVDTFKPDIMPKDFHEKLTADQLNDLITFLLSLK